MLHTINRFLRQRREDESGIALIFAILVMFIGLTISSVIAAYVLTAEIASRQQNLVLAFQAGTDSALANAMLQANSPDNASDAYLKAHSIADGSSTPGTTVPVYGKIALGFTTYPVSWRWYAQKVTRNTGNQTEWYIFADSYQTNSKYKWQDSNARHVRILLEPVRVSTASYNATNGITYIGDPTSAWQYGVFGAAAGNTSENFGSGTKLYSYDSASTTNPGTDTGHAAVGSNGTITLPSGTGVQAANLMGPAANCTGAGCANIQSTYNYGFTLSGITALVANKCPNAASSYPSWTASSGGLTNGGCYNTLTFDANTSVGTATNVYVKGNITVNAGVQVNYGGVPGNLRIYSQGGTAATFTNGSTSAPTYFSALVAGASLICSDTATGASSPSTLVYYGSMACSNVNLGPATTLWVDDEAATYSSTGTRNLYNITGYQVNYQ